MWVFDTRKQSFAQLNTTGGPAGRSFLGLTAVKVKTAVNGTSPLQQEWTLVLFGG